MKDRFVVKEDWENVHLLKLNIKSENIYLEGTLIKFVGIRFSQLNICVWNFFQVAKSIVGLGFS